MNSPHIQAAQASLGRLPPGSWDWVAAHAQLTAIQAQESPGSVPAELAAMAGQLHYTTLSMAGLVCGQTDVAKFTEGMEILANEQMRCVPAYLKLLSATLEPTAQSALSEVQRQSGRDRPANSPH